MIFKNGGGIVQGDGDNGTAAFFRDLEAPGMKRQKGVCRLVAGSLGEDADGDAAFYLIDGGKDGFRPLLDVIPIQEQAVQITHPAGQKGDLLHLHLRHITGGPGNPHIGHENIKKTPVVADVEHGPVPGNPLLADVGDLRPGGAQAETECPVHNSQAASVLYVHIEFADDPLSD